MRPLPGTTGPRIGVALWDAASAHFAYVHGTGDGNADASYRYPSRTSVARSTGDVP